MIDERHLTVQCQMFCGEGPKTLGLLVRQFGQLCQNRFPSTTCRSASPHMCVGLIVSAGASEVDVADHVEVVVVDVQNFD